MSRIFITAIVLAFAYSTASAQYFGRNKPRYQNIDFKVSETEHFTIYEYLNSPEKKQELAAAAEAWYNMHQQVLQDTIRAKNPLFIYNDHAGFQQTNVIQGDISVGTGGVTEGLRNRVVFPVAMTNQQTHHVLGHELVHAFQYNMILNGDSTGFQNLQNLPLWMIEGLAEYLSIGRIDPHTAIWMRDAVLNDDVPRIKDLNDAKYFPYRWGQAFWAYVTGVWGDEAIKPLFMNTAKYGLQISVPYTLGIPVDSLSAGWQQSLRTHFGQWAIKGKKENPPGKKLIDDKNAGTMNICPVLSPNGKYVIFLSEKNLFTTDLFLADAKTGKIIRKVASTASDGHIDQFNFLESAGAWSPDSKQFAFDVYEKGKSVMVIKGIEKGKKNQKITIPGVPAFSNPAWSPDGKTIVVSGLVNGQTDLYAYNLKTKKVQRLTNDRASEILPAFSADGKFLAFSTDATSLAVGRTNGAWKMNLAIMDMSDNSVENIDVFQGANNMNPQFDKNGDLLFLSDCDGHRNMYKYEIARKKVYQMTDLMTGITGITEYAPALTVSEDRDRILYTYYNNNEYIVYQAKNEDFTLEDVTSRAVNMIPASLPPFVPGQRDVVNQNLRLIDGKVAEEANEPITATKLKSKFMLEYAGGSTGIGVATGNSSFGQTTGAAGGVDLLFGDILGNHQLYSGLSLNGELIDAAGQFSYINQKRRWNWGGMFSHIPFRTGQYYQDFTASVDTSRNGFVYDGFTDTLLIQRLFQERFGLFTFYPFSVTKRLEFGGAYEIYKQRFDVYYNNIDVFNRLVDQTRERIPVPGGADHLFNLNAAYVGDNSYFGLTAPLQGWRYRLGVEKFFGAYDFWTFLADGRRYFYKKPFTLAVRGLAYGRFGGNANNQNEVYPLFAGQPNFVRGYTSQVLYETAPELIEQMIGSKLGVFNFEIRLPFTGPRRLSLIKSNFLITDLNLFFDAGVGFFEFSDLQPNDDPDIKFVQHKPLLSTGASVRVNLFGALVLEPYFALPLSVPEENRTWVFGLNFVPGW